MMNSNHNNNCAARTIAYARALKGLSQKALSEKSGIDQSDISKIERGAANPSVATLERIAKALGGELEINIRFNKESINNDLQDKGNMLNSD